MSSFPCYFRSLDPNNPLCFGSFKPDDVLSGKLAFHVEVHSPLPGGGILPALGKLTMTIPDSKEGAQKYSLDHYLVELRGKPVGNHNITVEFGAGSIVIDRKIVEEADDADVPDEVKGDVQYIDARSWSRLIKLVVTWNNDNFLTEEFLNTLDISSILPPVCHNAMRVFRNLFKASTGKFELYIIDGKLPVVFPSLDKLETAQQEELSHGSLVSRFYQDNDSSKMLTFKIMDIVLKPPNRRPQFKFEPRTAYPNVFEMCTRKAIAAVEVYEAEKANIKEVLSTKATMRAIGINAKNIEYFGAVTFLSPINKSFAVGDSVYLAIDPETFNKEPTRRKWRGFVCARPKWLHSGGISVCFRFFRPWVTNISNDGKGGYASWKIPSVLPKDESDKSCWEAYRKSETFEVQVCCDISDLTARCQIDGAAAFRIGGFQNFDNMPLFERFEAAKVSGWLLDKRIAKEAEFWCLKNTLPEKYVDYLGEDAAKSLLRILEDQDHREVVAYLRKMPNGLGVLKGPAGTGKTWLMAQIIAAKHAANITKDGKVWKTIVVVPSNHPADVAAENISHAFANHSVLKDEYILRPLPSHRKQQITALGSMSTRILVSEWADIFVNNLKGVDPDKKEDGNEDEKNETRQHLHGILTALRLFLDIYYDHSHDMQLMERDDRFKSLKSTIGYHCLALAGFKNIPRNEKYTDSKFDGFSILLGRFIDGMLGKDEKLEKEKCQDLACIQKPLVEYVIKNASILVSTPATLSSRFYVRNFQSRNLDMVFDEAGRVVFPEYASMFASYRPQTRLLLGDVEQLRPIITVKNTYGCAAELTVSVMESLLKVHWPFVSLFYNRRSSAGLIDIPSKLFYDAKLISHPSLSKCDLKHPHTKSWKLFLKKTFPGLTDTAGAYVEAMSSDSIKDGSRSVFNLGNAALIINIIEKAVLRDGFQVHLFIIIATYKAQVFVYRDALRELEKKHPGKGFDDINVETVDAFQGGGCQITLVDFVVTKYTGFLRDSGRLNVATTRAIDGSLTVLRGDGLRNYMPGTINWPVVILTEAQLRGILVRVVAGDKLLKHEFVKDRF